MADTFLVLAQAAPGATVLTDLYTVPGATQAVVSSVVVCNQNAASIKFRLSVAVAGAADTPKQYLYYDATIPKNASLTCVLGVSLGAADVVRGQTDTANVSFSVFGVQVA